MSQKRKSTSVGATSQDNAGTRESLKSADMQVSEQPVERSKRRRISLAHHDSLQDTRRAMHEADEEKPKALTRKLAAAKKIEDLESDSTKTASSKSRRVVELKADIMKSRDEERQRAERAEASIERLKFKIKELSSKSEQQAAKIKHLESSKLAASGQDKIYFQDDDTIRGNITLLFELISRWALNWAHEDFFSSHMDQTYGIAATNMLAGRSKHLETRVLREKAIPKCFWATAGCRLATEAFLANTIAKLFLVRPFNIPIQSDSDKNTNMEDYVRRIRDGMKGSQVESRLWTSNTLRSHYSPDQYADNIVKPIINDRFEEARTSMCESVVSEWISQNDSPLAAVLKPCQGPEVEYRRTGLIKILHAASKLSLQLWTQDSEVAVIDNMHDQKGLLHLFNDEVADVHPLMPEIMQGTVLRDRKIDLLVWPRLKVTRFSSIHPGTTRHISTKASVVIFNTQVCKDNQADFDKSIVLSPKATAVEASTWDQSGYQDPKDVAILTHDGSARSHEAFPDGIIYKSNTGDPHQSSEGLLDTGDQKTRQGFDVHKLIAQSGESTANTSNAGTSPATEPNSSIRGLIDLTDEGTTYQSAENLEEPQESMPKHCSQNTGLSNTSNTTECRFPRTTRADSTRSEYPSTRSEENQEHNEKSSAKNLQKSEPKLPAVRESSTGRQAGENLRSGAASRTGSTEPQGFQIQEHEATRVVTYQFVELDPTVEMFGRPLELPDFGDHAPDQHDVEGDEALTREVEWEKDYDSIMPDAVDFADTGNEDGDDAMHITTKAQVTMTNELRDEISGESKVDTYDAMDIITAMELETDKMYQGEDKESITTHASDPASTSNEDDDTIEVILPGVPTTTVDNPLDEAGTDPKIDLKHVKAVDEKVEIKDTGNGLVERQNDIDEPTDFKMAGIEQAARESRRSLTGLDLTGADMDYTEVDMDSNWAG